MTRTEKEDKKWKCLNEMKEQRKIERVRECESEFERVRESSRG